MSGNTDDRLDNSPHLADSLLHFVEDFRKAYDLCNEKDSFLFFSDPHLLGFNSSFSAIERREFYASFQTMRTLYDYLPLEFVLCGGDWLNNSDTRGAAKEKLLFANEKMTDWFQPYHKIMGNHDYNYQGVVSATSSERGDFTFNFINDIYYADEGKAYYTFQGDRTKFIVFDTGIDWTVTIDDYRKEQLEWLSQLLQKNEEDHLAIGMHMLYYGKMEGNSPFPMAKEILGICGAFNRRDLYASSVINCDFIEAKGTVHFVLCGHNHIDFMYDDSGIPCVGITRLITNGCPSYDLCLIDYDNGLLKMIRVGNGSNRIIPLAKSTTE